MCECDKCKTKINRGMAGSAHKVINVVPENIDSIVNDVDFPDTDEAFQQFLEDNKEHHESKKPQKFRAPSKIEMITNQEREKEVKKIIGDLNK